MLHLTPSLYAFIGTSEQEGLTRQYANTPKKNHNLLLISRVTLTPIRLPNTTAYRFSSDGKNYSGLHSLDGRERRDADYCPCDQVDWREVDYNCFKISWGECWSAFTCTYYLETYPDLTSSADYRRYVLQSHEHSSAVYRRDYSDMWDIGVLGLCTTAFLNLLFVT